MLRYRSGLSGPFILAAFDNMHRWRAAHLSLQQRSELLAIEKGRAPLLERLSLRIPICILRLKSSCIVEDLFHGEAPRLRSLKMYRIGLRNWGSEALSGLRVLHLRRLPTQPSHSIDQILEVLVECPDIEDLLLHIRTAKSDASKTQPRTIQLPQLEKLNLLGMPRGPVKLLLATIKCSRCVQIKVTATGEIHPSLISAITSFSAPSLATAVLVGIRIRLSIYPTITVTVKSRTSIVPDFILEVPYTSDASWLPPFLKQSGGILPVSISYSNPFPTNSPSPFVNLFLIAFVNGIELYAMDQGLDELIQELSRGGTLLDGVVAWRFPELKEFRVHSGVDYDPELLLSMARARTEAATCLRGGEVVAGGRPTLLERLEISVLDKLMDQETWKETKATLGEGAIWNRAPHLGEVPETIGLEPEGGTLSRPETPSTATVSRLPPSS